MKYLEELYLFASKADTREIAEKLAHSFVLTKPGIQDLTVRIRSLEEDELGIQDRWQQQFGGSVDSVDYILSLIEYRFSLQTDSVQELETLSMEIYQVIRESLKGFGAVEYFSMFSEDIEAG